MSLVLQGFLISVLFIGSLKARVVLDDWDSWRGRRKVNAKEGDWKETLCRMGSGGRPRKVTGTLGERVTGPG